MKNLIFAFVALTVFGFHAQAADSCTGESTCFVTDKCVETITACKLVGTVEQFGGGNMGKVWYRAHAAMRLRHNVQHGCSSNAGISTVWEQAESQLYQFTEDADTAEEAKDKALQDCKDDYAFYLKVDGSCK